MTEAEARQRLSNMVAATSEPTIDTATLDQLLASAARPDTDGNIPTDTGWSPTYDFNYAAAEGWRWKAGKVAGSFTFGSDGQQFNKSDITKACLAMANTYSRRVAGSMPLNIGTSDWDSDIAVNTNA